MRKRINSAKIRAADDANSFCTTTDSSSRPLNAMRIRWSEVIEVKPLEFLLKLTSNLAITCLVSTERSVAHFEQIFRISGKQSENLSPTLHMREFKLFKTDVLVYVSDDLVIFVAAATMSPTMEPQSLYLCCIV